MTSISLNDLTGDGQTDWALYIGGYGYWEHCRRLYIISWIDGAFVNLTEEGYEACFPVAGGEHSLDPNLLSYQWSQNPPQIREALVTMIEGRSDGWECDYQELT